MFRNALVVASLGVASAQWSDWDNFADDMNTIAGGLEDFDNALG